MLKSLTAILMLAMLTLLSGCSALMHELQPHRLWRWNYHPAPAVSSDVLFSIDDPVIPQMPAQNTLPEPQDAETERSGSPVLPLPAHE